MKCLKLRTNGMVSPYELNEEKYDYKFRAMQKAIDCDMIDIVHAVNLPEPYCLVVDDEALLKSAPMINLLASYLYGTASHGQPICGDVLIMKDEWTEDGIDTVGLSDSEISNLVMLLSDEKVISGMGEILEKLRGSLR